MFGLIDLLLLKRHMKGWWTIPSGVDYSRTCEWPLAANSLELKEGLSILDVGSGDNSLFPLLVAYKEKVRLLAVDFSDEMRLLRSYAQRGKEEGWLKGAIDFENADIRALPFPDRSFDRVSCVSTIEHIPDDGDVQGIRELARVLKPGGKLVLTVPFIAQGRDEYKEDFVYERAAAGEFVFFQRLYDFASIEDRLIRPSGLRCEKRHFLVEPTRRYFWEQDCRREQKDGKTVLYAERGSYLKRCLALPYSLLYTRRVDEETARKTPESLFAAAFILAK